MDKEELTLRSYLKREGSSWPSESQIKRSYCPSDEIKNFTERVKEQCKGSYSLDRPLEITILGSLWSVSSLDSILFSQELGIQLGKLPEVKVTFLVPEKSYSGTFKRVAANSSAAINIVEVQRVPGFNDPIDWLYFPPKDLKTDIVVGAGEQLGKIAQVFKEFHQCKNIYITSDPLEKHAVLLEKRRILEKKIASHEEWKNDVGLCQKADLAVAPGPKMHDHFSNYLLRHCNKNFSSFTPGILSEFSDVTHATTEGINFRILVLGGEYPDNFEQDGRNTVAEAVAELKDKSYHLLHVSSAEGKYESVLAQKFYQCGVSPSQLTKRSLPKNGEELKILFCQADLAIMPSSKGGFGMMALAALSSGLPVLAHEDSGFGVALKKVPFGASSTVKSEDAKVWAHKIKGVREKDREIRLQEAADLRSYYDKKYSWKEQCGALVQKMSTMVAGMNFVQLTHSIFSLFRPSDRVQKKNK